MYDVPYEVKKALRAGIYRKNYRFLISEETTVITYKWETSDIISASDTCDISATGLYRFYNEYVNTGFSFSYLDSEGETIVVDVEAAPGASVTNYEFEFDEPTTVTMISSNAELSVQLRIESESTEKQYLFTIDNNTLVKESVKIDERMCSSNEIKFGLAEGSSLEFQYFDHPNINGMQIQAFIDAEYKDDNNQMQWYSIPLGFFTVDQAPMQFSTGIRKVIAYNKLQSKYLDQKANNLLNLTYTNPNATITLYDIQKSLLSDYQIGIAEETIITPAMADSFVQNSGYSASFKTKTFASGDLTSPLNIQMLGGSATSTAAYTVKMVSGVYRYTLDPDETYSIRSDYDLDAYEDTIYSYLATYLQKSGVNNPTSQLNKFVKTVTVEYDLYNYLPSGVRGWATMCGIILKKPDNTYEYYSKIGYKNSLPNCHASMGDLQRMLFKGYTELILIRPGTFGKGSLSDGTWVPLGAIWYDTPFTFYKSPGNVVTNATYYKITDAAGNDYPDAEDSSFFQLLEVRNLTAANMVQIPISKLPEFTLREIISANYETVCQFGQLNRETDLFMGVELNNGGLYPRETLYPNDGLYPNAEYPRSSFRLPEYEQLWTDTVGTQSFKYLIITYKTTETDSQGNIQEVEKTLQRTVNPDGTTNYNMSDNWLFKNLIWTADQVAEYAEVMVEKMRNITWFPFEMWAPGLPYAETGDMIEITDRSGDTHVSYILQRQLNGIHNLKDTFINGELDIF